MAALLTMIASLRTFSADKLQFWRESASGVNRIAFFMAKDMADLFNVVLRPVIYLSMFYFFCNPRSSLVDNYVITLVLVYCVTGLAYIFAILVEPAPAQLVSFPQISTHVTGSKPDAFDLLKMWKGLSYLVCCVARDSSVSGVAQNRNQKLKTEIKSVEFATCGHIFAISKSQLKIRIKSVEFATNVWPYIRHFQVSFQLGVAASLLQ